MAKRYVLNRAKNADKRTALLGLTLAGRGGDKGSCLSDEDMAALVDGVCSREERACYLQHLENCEDCYQHWVKLSEIVLSREKKRGRGDSNTIVRPKYLAWAGSLLAAAASVVLFLNITREPPPSVVHRSMKTTFEQKSPSTVEAQQGAMSAGKPVPSRTGVDTSADKVDDGVTAEDTLTPAATIMKMREQTSKEYFPSESTTVKRKMEAGNRNALAPPGQYESTGARQRRSPVWLWLDDVQQGCQIHETNRQFWVEQYMLGKQMTRFQKAEEKKLVQELLPLVGKLREPAVKKSSVCERILRHFDDYSAE